ncbi:hypothetical protein N8750_01035 [bacterium]|nr:hypothetical protein [bacterium]
MHPSPDQLDEFIELVSTSDRPLRLDPLRLIKTTAAGTSAHRFFTTPPSFCALPVPLFPLLAPHQLRAFPSPTALPNDSTSLLLQTTDAQTLDQLNYTPWDAPLEHRSWERISLLSSGRTPSNWVPHHARWCCPTEASPNEKNSCSFPATPPDFNAHLQRTHLSYDLNHYLPSTDLWVSMAAGEILSLRLLDRSGRPLTQWLSYEGISGRNPIGIGPYLWNESPLETGIYTLQVRLKKSSLVRIKNLPLSIYNP